MKNITMRTRMKVFAVAAFCTLLAANGNADCGFSAIPRSPVAWPVIQSEQPQAAAEALPKLAERDAQEAQDASIVGLWKVTFTSGRQVVDQGFDQWHSDGTEILNDTPPPSTGNVCLGVWVKTGRLDYKLKHPSWNFDAAGNLTGTTIIRELISLDPRGDSYKGTFTFDVFDLSGKLLFHSTGTIAAQRITAD